MLIFLNHCILQVVFSALVHDCDHPGVSNAQLVKEEEATALMYENKSVAEQNSIDLVRTINFVGLFH